MNQDSATQENEHKLKLETEKEKSEKQMCVMSTTESVSHSLKAKSNFKSKNMVTDKTCGITMIGSRIMLITTLIGVDVKRNFN